MPLPKYLRLLFPLTFFLTLVSIHTIPRTGVSSHLFRRKGVGNDQEIVEVRRPSGGWVDVVENKVVIL